MTSESLGGVTHARQRSIRDKRHRRDCERVAQQLLGKLNISQEPILIIQTSSKSFIFFYPCWVNGNFINSASYLEQSHFPTPLGVAKESMFAAFRQNAHLWRMNFQNHTTYCFLDYRLKMFSDSLPTFLRYLFIKKSREMQEESFPSLCSAHSKQLLH